MVETAGLLPLPLTGIVILIAIFLSIIAKKLGHNVAIGFIFTGFLLGPFGLNLLHPQDPLVIAFSELGLFILLFYLGLELSWKQFLEAGSSGFGLALLDMAASTLAGFLISIIFGFSLLFSILVGFMLFSTSTAIVAKFAIDKGIFQLSSTKLAVSILILQDFLGILLVVLITSISKSGSALSLALTALIFAIGVFVTVYQLSRFVEQWMLSNNFGHTEVTLYALGVGLIVSTIASTLGLSTSIGAYFAGFALAETQAGERIKKDVSFMRDFFLVFFFVGFGTTIFFNPAATVQALPALETFAPIALIAVALAASAVVAHFTIFSVFGAYFGLSKEDSVTSAILLAPLGEFVVIIAAAAVLVVTASEKAVIPVLAFLLILITVFAFQPLYNFRGILERLSSALPSFSRPVRTSKVETHTPYSYRQLKDFAWNLFVVLCLAWLTVTLYYKLPAFGIPIPYVRQFSSALLFMFFAIAPLLKSMIALRNILKSVQKKSHSTA